MSFRSKRLTGLRNGSLGIYKDRIGPDGTRRAFYLEAFGYEMTRGDPDNASLKTCVRGGGASEESHLNAMGTGWRQEPEKQITDHYWRLLANSSGKDK